MVDAGWVIDGDNSGLEDWDNDSAGYMTVYMYHQKMPEFVLDISISTSTWEVENVGLWKVEGRDFKPIRSISAAEPHFWNEVACMVMASNTKLKILDARTK